MKKKKSFGILIMTMGVLFVGVILYLQWGRDIDVMNSFSETSGDFHEVNITVTVNWLIVLDKEECAKEIIKKCRENAFRSFLFSYDERKPNALNGTVYLFRKSMHWQKPLFRFSYVQKTENTGNYNIVDGPEAFRVKVY